MREDYPFREKIIEIQISMLDLSRPERTLKAISFMDLSIQVMHQEGKSESFIDEFMEETRPLVYAMFRVSEQNVGAVCDAMMAMRESAGVPLEYSITPDGRLHGRPYAGNAP